MYFAISLINHIQITAGSRKGKKKNQVITDTPPGPHFYSAVQVLLLAQAGRLHLQEGKGFVQPTGNRQLI